MLTLRILREQKGWIQEHLATKAGVSLPMVVNIEKGRPVTRKVALKVCQALGVALDDVAGVVISSRADVSLSPFRQRREAKGWSQQDLAAAIDVCFTTISDMERGKAVNRLVMLLACQALGVSIEELSALNLFSQKEVECYRFLLKEDHPQETQHLRAIRKAKGWKTQASFAEAADVSSEVIWRAENGKTINRMSAVKICWTLGVPLSHVALHITSSMRGEAWIVSPPP